MPQTSMAWMPDYEEISNEYHAEDAKSSNIGNRQN
jgi:hypothetical protein